MEGMFRDFVRSPSYEGKLGFLHLVESDLREVLKLVATPERPLVLFIDDLNRLRVLLKGAGEGPEAEGQISEVEVAQAETQMEQAGNLGEVEALTLEKMNQEQGQGKKAVLREASKRVYARKLARHDPMVQL